MTGIAEDAVTGGASVKVIMMDIDDFDDQVSAFKKDHPNAAVRMSFRIGIIGIVVSLIGINLTNIFRCITYLINHISCLIQYGSCC